jgi:hypothetical protein
VEHLRKIVFFFHTISDENDLYMKIISFAPASPLAPHLGSSIFFSHSGAVAKVILVEPIEIYFLGHKYESMHVGSN